MADPNRRPSYWLNGTEIAKTYVPADGETYFSTSEGAKDHLIERQGAELKRLTEILDRAARGGGVDWPYPKD